MTKICCNKERITNTIIPNIYNLLKNFDEIELKLKETSIPSDFLYYEYMLSINDLIIRSKYIFINLVDDINSFNKDIMNNEQYILQSLNNIDDMTTSIVIN